MPALSNSTREIFLDRMHGDIQLLSDFLIGQAIALAQQKDGSVERRQLLEERLHLLRFGSTFGLKRRFDARYFSELLQRFRVVGDGFALSSQPELGYQIHCNAIEVSARLANQLDSFDAQQPQIGLLREILCMLRTTQPTHQEPVQFGVVLLGGTAGSCLVTREFRYALVQFRGFSPDA